MCLFYWFLLTLMNSSCILTNEKEQLHRPIAWFDPDLSNYSLSSTCRVIQCKTKPTGEGWLINSAKTLNEDAQEMIDRQLNSSWTLRNNNCITRLRDLTLIFCITVCHLGLHVAWYNARQNWLEKDDAKTLNEDAEAKSRNDRQTTAQNASNTVRTYE